MVEEFDFLDLMALTKIGQDTVVEKFGSLINSSFFDASNILGTLKIKGLIDFSTTFPGQNAITITDLGKQLINEASSKVSEPFDQLDLAILQQLSGGKRTLVDVGSAVNISPRPLALHLFKLTQQQYVSTTLRSGTVGMMLTEKGFLQMKQGMPTPAAPPQVATVQPTPQQAATLQAGAPQAPSVQPQAVPLQPQAPPSQQPMSIQEVERVLAQARNRRRNIIILTIVIVVVIAAAAMFAFNLIRI
jgi:hypothetical protein